MALLLNCSCLVCYLLSPPPDVLLIHDEQTTISRRRVELQRLQCDLFDGYLAPTWCMVNLPALRAVRPSVLSPSQVLPIVLSFSCSYSQPFCGTGTAALKSSNVRSNRLASYASIILLRTRVCYVCLRGSSDTSPTPASRAVSWSRRCEPSFIVYMFSL